MTPSRPRAELLLPLACAAVLSATACDDGPIVPKATGCAPSDGPLPHEALSEYCLFEGPMSDLVPAGGHPYDVAAPLWSDHAEKHRFIALPEGQKVTFGEGEDWVYPIGTILVKTFAFRDDFRDPTSARRILETRLLLLDEAGWSGEVYRWNDEQTEATRIVAGERADVTFITESGESVTEEYIVPNQNQCKSCHERDDAMTFLGPFTEQMNRPVQVGDETRNQLEALAEAGLFDGDLPPTGSLPAFPDPFGDAPLDDRARAYLHANCSHCHRPGGGGGPSGLVLLAWEKDPAKNGVCKAPAAAGQGTGGHNYDIVPGHPEQSIMIFRMSSTDPDVKMPELPNRIPDDQGVELVSEWITALEPEGCP